MSFTWFETKERLQDFITDLIIAELSIIRRDFQLTLKSIPIPAQMAFDEHGLALDSLELMRLSMALTRVLHFEASGVEDNLLDKPMLADWVEIAVKSLKVYSEQISFKSSGTTGFRNHHAHKLEHLEEEAQCLSQPFSGCSRILRAVPSHHIYGFIFTVLLPRFLGTSVEVVDIRGLSSNSIQSIIRPGDLMVAFPEFWQFMDESNIRFVNNVIGVNSSGSCSSRVGMNLMAKGLSGFYEVYGSTETAGIGWRDYPLADYTLFPFWEKSPTSDYEIYRLIKKGIKQLYSVQDHLIWSSTTQFVVKGRVDNVVQVGGVNVFLDDVRNTLLKHPQVKDAAIRLMSPDEGSRLKAFIVLNQSLYLDSNQPMNETNIENVLNDLKHYMDTNLSSVERPKSITFGEAIPKNKMGKLTDWPI